MDDATYSKICDGVSYGTTLAAIWLTNQGWKRARRWSSRCVWLAAGCWLAAHWTWLSRWFTGHF